MQQHRPSQIIVVDGYSHKILKNSYTKYLQKLVPTKPEKNNSLQKIIKPVSNQWKKKGL